jgi:molybdopterin/thiamine biosynthesis adenylyltransferase
MSGNSRINKLIDVVIGTGPDESACAKRGINFQLIVDENCVNRISVLVRPTIALAVRCFSGEIYVAIHGSKNFFDQVQHDVLMEAELYQAAKRIKFSDKIQEKNHGLAFSIGGHIQNAICVDASGDIAAINQCFETNVPRPTAAAAAFAVAAGFSKVFSVCCLGETAYQDESWYFSLATFQKVSAPVKVPQTDLSLCLGRIGLLGAGAIGSAFAYILSLSEDRANLDIVDRDKYEEPNKETTFFLSPHDATQFIDKAKFLAEKTQRPGLSVSGLPRQEIDMNSAFLRESYQYLICAVDNKETRQQLDNCSSRWVLNGGLGDKKDNAGHVFCSRHGEDPMDRPLSELYPDLPTQVPSDTGTKDCSRIEYENTTLAAPFLALGCGAILVAQCRVLSTGKGSPNYLLFDFLKYQNFYTRRN